MIAKSCYNRSKILSCLLRLVVESDLVPGVQGVGTLWTFVVRSRPHSEGPELLHIKSTRGGTTLRFAVRLKGNYDCITI